MENKNKSAFPSHVGMEESYPNMDARNRVSGGGLNKREYYAAKAMQSMLAAWASTGNDHDPMIVKRAVELADALLAELEK